MNVRADGGKLFDHLFVAALDVVDAFENSHAARAQAGNDKGRAGTQVAGLDWRACDVRHAFDDGSPADDPDGTAHFGKLVRVAEPIVPNALRDGASPRRSAENRGNLRLHVSRKTGVWHGFDMGAEKGGDAADSDGILMFENGNAHFAQLAGNALEVLGDDVLDENLAARARDSRHIRPGLDLVRDDGIETAVETARSADFYDVSAGAANVGAHGVKEVSEIDNVRLPGGVLDESIAISEGGAEHEIDRGTDRDDVEIYRSAAQTAAGRCRDDAVLHCHLRAHGDETFHVLVDRADAAEIATAGHCDIGLAEPAEQGADEVV